MGWWRRRWRGSRTKGRGRDTRGKKRGRRRWRRRRTEKDEEDGGRPRINRSLPYSLPPLGRLSPFPFVCPFNYYSRLAPLATRLLLSCPALYSPAYPRLPVVISPVTLATLLPLHHPATRTKPSTLDPRRRRRRTRTVDVHASLRRPRPTDQTANSLSFLLSAFLPPSLPLFRRLFPPFFLSLVSLLPTASRSSTHSVSLGLWRAHYVSFSLLLSFSFNPSSLPQPSRRVASRRRVKLAAQSRSVA